MYARIQHYLSRSSAGLSVLALIGIGIGFLAGLIAIAFRFSLEYLTTVLLQTYNVTEYEQLPQYLWFVLPILTVLLIMLVWHLIPAAWHAVGIPHVLERLHFQFTHLPAGNALAQFLGAVIALVGGLSVGKEGPTVHLGAFAGSLLGRTLKLPLNVQPILIGAGTAAGIAAVFNTPLAGVAFAMEVVLLGYSVQGFLPIILASFVATLVTRSVFAEHALFDIPPVLTPALAQLPEFIALGVLTGLVGLMFVSMSRQLVLRSITWTFYSRFAAAGVATAAIASVWPQVMSSGYDSISLAAQGEITLWLLAGILLGKIIATAFATGMGIPGGVIAPTMVMGALCGSLLAQATGEASVAQTAQLTVLGIAGAMAAILQAPLAAIMALLEISGRADLLFPALVVVVLASMISGHFSRYQSIFALILSSRGLNMLSSENSQPVKGEGVLSLMDSRVLVVEAETDRAALLEQLQSLDSRWVIVYSNPHQRVVFSREEILARVSGMHGEQVQLLEADIHQYSTGEVDYLDSSYQADLLFRQNKYDVLCVMQQNEVLGIITQARLRYSQGEQ